MHVSLSARACVCESGTWVKAPGGCSPAHDGGDGAHHRPHPGVDDAEPLQGGVAAGVQEDVQGPQEPREGVDGQREQGHARHAAGQGEGDGVQRADGVRLFI